MELVALVTILALIQAMSFQWGVGKGRDKFNVPASATSDHPIWEARAYVRDAASRGTGVWLTDIVLYVLAIGSLVGVFRAAL